MGSFSVEFIEMNAGGASTNKVIATFGPSSPGLSRKGPTLYISISGLAVASRTYTLKMEKGAVTDAAGNRGVGLAVGTYTITTSSEQVILEGDDDFSVGLIVLFACIPVAVIMVCVGVCLLSARVREAAAGIPRRISSRRWSERGSSTAISPTVSRDSSSVCGGFSMDSFAIGGKGEPAWTGDSRSRTNGPVSYKTKVAPR